MENERRKLFYPLVHSPVWPQQLMLVLARVRDPALPTGLHTGVKYVVHLPLLSQIH